MRTSSRPALGYRSTDLVLTVLLLVLCNITFTAYRVLHSMVPLPYPACESNVPLTVEQTKLTTTPRVTVRCMLLFHSGVPNYEVLITWVEFHRQRWGVTHVDVFVHERLSEMRAVLNYALNDTVKFEVFYTHYHQYPMPKGTGLNGEMAVMMNRVLLNAKRNNNTFVLFNDPDEFIISEDFRNFEEMFKGGHDAVSFPMFTCNYRICTDNAMVFGSLGFQDVVPHGSIYVNNASLDYYTEPPVSCGGHRKYIVRTDKWDHLDHVHDPVTCTTGPRGDLPSETRRRVLYLTGRHQDGEHVRVVHLRSERGIHADNTMFACSAICKCAFTSYNGECLTERDGARFELRDTEINRLLKDRPLFPDAPQIALDAVCYAERYSFLLQDFCDNDVKKCRYGALYRHYYDSGRDKNYTWGCKIRHLDITYE